MSTSVGKLPRLIAQANLEIARVGRLLLQRSNEQVGEKRDGRDESD